MIAGGVDHLPALREALAAAREGRVVVFVVRSAEVADHLEQAMLKITGWNARAGRREAGWSNGGRLRIGCTEDDPLRIARTRGVVLRFASDWDWMASRSAVARWRVAADILGQAVPA